MRDLVTTCGEILGATFISIGAFMVAPALGFFVAGAFLIGVCWLASR